MAVSQTRTVSSAEPVTTFGPPGSYASDVIGPVCPRITASSAARPASQIRTVRSSPAEAIRRPSGLNATARTSSVCPFRIGDAVARVFGVPELDCVVEAGGRDAYGRRG